jgi:hypothetical protein
MTFPMTNNRSTCVHLGLSLALVSEVAGKHIGDLEAQAVNSLDNPHQGLIKRLLPVAPAPGVPALQAWLA